MLRVTIHEKGGSAREEEFQKDEITVGRIQGNDIVLPKGNISKRHSKIELSAGRFVVTDLNSTNGTYVNGRKLTEPQVVGVSDKIYIGDFTLQLVSEADAFEAVDDDDGGIDLLGSRPSDGPALIDESFDRAFPSAEPRLGDEPEAAIPEEPEFAALEPMSSPELRSEEETPFPAEPEPAVVRLTEERPVGSLPSATASTAARSRSARDAASPMARAPSTAAVSVPMVRAATGSEAVSTDALFADLDESVALLHEQAVRELGLRDVQLEGLVSHRSALTEWVRSRASWLSQAGVLHPATDLDLLTDRVVSRATDFDPLLELILDESVEDILVTPDRRVWAEREGRVEATGAELRSGQAMTDVVFGLSVMGGGPAYGVDEVAVRLRDGARVSASLGAHTFRGAALSYRKPTREAFTLARLVDYQTLSSEMVSFLHYGIQYQESIVLSVGEGVNPCATLNAFLAQMLDEERIATIEPNIELFPGALKNLVSFDPCYGDSVGALLDQARRLKPDRMLIGDIRGDAAVPRVLQAFAGSLAGSICAYSASSPQELLDAMSLADLSSHSPSLDHARRLVANAVRIIVQENRFSDQSRRITRIAEVVLNRDGELHAQDIFQFEEEGLDDAGMVMGRFRATGHIPKFIEALVHRGESVNLDIFRR